MSALSAQVTQEIVRYELMRRNLTVLRAQDISPDLRRITFGGEDLDSLEAPGPADHVKLFFPIPEEHSDTTESVVLARDYTPRSLRRSAEGTELDIDFLVHGDSGPASRWASRAEAGDQLQSGGPRGSKLFPRGIISLVVLADESALAAAARWLERATVPTQLLLIAENAATSKYFDDVAAQPATITWFTGANRYEDAEQALRNLAVQEGTYYFAAGEATALIPIRRYLRRELGLLRNVVAVDGYWKRGVGGHDHHAPLDPADPD